MDLLIKVRDKASLLYNGKLFPVFIAICVLLGHLFSLEAIFIPLIVVVSLIGFAVCDTLEFMLAPLLMTLFTASQKTVAAGGFYTGSAKVLFVACAVLFVALSAFHFIVYRKKVDFSALKQSGLLFGYVLIAAAFMLNGFFCFDKYTIGNFTYALILMFSMCVSFAFFAINLDKSKNFKEYAIYVLYIASLVVTAEFFAMFAGQIKFDNGSIVKESILIGWGMWNNIGGVLTMLLPVHFYLAATKKHGYIFYATGILSYLAVALSLSRSSLLVSTVLAGICAVILCFVGINKKQNRIILALLAAVTACIIAIFWSKIAYIFSDYISRGFNDNGRFAMWKDGVEKFISHPLFGVGFYNSYPTSYQFISFLPYRYHNTIIELIATCGVAGLASYAFHRYQTIKLFIGKKNICSLFMMLCTAGLLLTSLFDNHMFNIYPCFYYSVFLLATERSE